MKVQQNIIDIFISNNTTEDNLNHLSDVILEKTKEIHYLKLLHKFIKKLGKKEFIITFTNMDIKDAYSTLDLNNNDFMILRRIANRLKSPNTYIRLGKK